jgi:NAD(P)-dependent dehydrogenase (short-subunit alcohol dehydrogenase family)
MTSHTSPVWFITGCSSGFGRELAKLVLARGWRVAATARDAASVHALTRAAPERALALALDVSNPTQIAAARDAVEEKFGAIDVLVNNAGYGYQASVEEGDDKEIRDLFETNVFGLFAITRAVLPGMRSRRRGHIINITSLAGFIGYAGSGYYAATKHAVEGWSDALAAECKPFGVHVTCVAPGPFRTDWAGRSLHRTPTRLLDYAATVGAREQSLAQNSGRQPGDPVRAGEAMIRISEMATPPRHLVLGAIAFNAVTDTLRERLAEIESWKETSLSTDYPAA